MESYIYHIKNNLVDDEGVASVVSSEDQCAEARKFAMEAEG